MFQSYNANSESRSPTLVEECVCEIKICLWDTKKILNPYNTAVYVRCMWTNYSLLSRFLFSLTTLSSRLSLDTTAIASASADCLLAMA